jgi:hypothetical protein
VAHVKAKKGEEASLTGETIIMRLSIQVFTATLLIFGLHTETQARGFGAVRGGTAVGARGGVARGQARGGVATGPIGGVQARGSRGGTYVTPRGTTIQHGRAGGVSRGPAGGVRAGGAQGTRVTTPGGRTYTRGSAGSAAVGPLGGVHTRGASGTAVRGPFGSAAAGQRGGVAVGPRGGVAGSRTVAAGHRTRYYSPTALRTQATYVRSSFRSPVFTPTWYRSHTVAWRARRWVGSSVWLAPAWPALSVYCGITAPPIVYDYGSTVVIENNNVYVNGTQVASAEQYANQAIQFADRGRQANPADTEEWQSLGVFGMIQGEEQTAQHIFQLAVNKAGVVHGNYYNAVADNTLPVYGSVDRTSQRVAWSIGDKKDIVFEAGLDNLTQPQTPVLIHYGKERTEQMVLVRLEEPREG